MARTVTIAAIAAAVLLAATGCLTPLTSQQPLTPVPTPANPLVGVYEPGTPASWSQVAEFTDATGVRPRIAVYYSSWNEPFSTSFAQTAWSHDAYVLVQLEPRSVTLASVAAGGSDAYLRSYADAVVAFGHPVILSFGHEMNGTWPPRRSTAGPPATPRFPPGCASAAGPNTGATAAPSPLASQPAARSPSPPWRGSQSH